MDELKMGVDEMFMSRLGREATDQERAELADWLLGRFKAQGQQEIDTAREKWESGIEVEGQPPPPGSQMTPAEAMLEGVDGAGDSEAEFGNEINPGAEFTRRWRPSAGVKGIERGLLKR